MRALNVPTVNIRVPSINCTLNSIGDNVNMNIQKCGFRIRSLKKESGSSFSIFFQNCFIEEVRSVHQPRNLNSNL
jgi:hypothetical protein